MSKPIIAIDADDTLFDENNAVRLFHNEKYGTNHTEEDFLAEGEFGTFWEHIWHTDVTETLRRYEEFIEWKLEHNLPPLPGAMAVLTELKQKYDLVMVTMRGEPSVAMTQQALTEHFPDVFRDVHFVPLCGDDDKATKAQICHEIGANYLIDDGFHHGELAVEAGLKSLLFGHYGWNRTQKLPPHMTRVKDWAAVKVYFDAA